MQTHAVSSILGFVINFLSNCPNPTSHNFLHEVFKILPSVLVLCYSCIQIHDYKNNTNGSCTYTQKFQSELVKAMSILESCLESIAHQGYDALLHPCVQL